MKIMTENYTHTRRLAQFLEMENMGQSELKSTVERTIPRELAYHDFDGKVVNARELLISEGVQGSTLIPTEIYATVLEGAEPVKCMRDVLPMYQVKGQQLNVPYGESGTYAPVVAEGAEIPVQDQTYGSAPFVMKKYAVRPLITNEMVDDALFDIIATEVRKSGMRLENALNFKALQPLVDNATHTANCGGSGATPLLFAAEALAKITGAGFTPDKFVISPTYMGAIMKEGMVFNTQFGTDIIKSGNIGNIMGCTTRLLGISETTTGGKVWGFTTSGNVGAFMFDSRAAGAIGMRQDIKVEQYADSIRQMQGVSVSMRFDVQSFLPAAIANVVY